MVLNNPSNPTQGLIQQAQFAYKSNNKWPANGTDNFTKYVAIANRLKDQWAYDANVFWNSLFREDSLGVVVSGTQDYPLDSDVISLSDGVYITRTDGNIDQYVVVHPNARNNYDPTRTTLSYSGDNGTYLSGSPGNLVLNFITPFTQTPQDIGGTINVGVYALPPDYVNDTDDILIDDPQWLVYALAAELARNDPAKQDQFPTLLGTANDLYAKMVAYNEGNSYQQPDSPTYQIKNAGVTWSEN